MYLVSQPKIEIRLISDEGEVAIYEDYDEFINHTSYWFVDRHVVNNFKEWLENWLWFYSRGERATRYIVRDQFNSVYTKTELLNDIRELNYKKYKLKELAYEFRYDPVPRTGKRNWHFSTWYKVPRTTQEKRWNCAHGEYVRGRRRKGWLADAYDDYPRSDVGIKRSWKKQKKRRQWI